VHILALRNKILDTKSLILPQVSCKVIYGTYINDLLVITNETLDNHLLNIEVLPDKLKKGKLRCDAPKYGGGLQEIKYLGYTLFCNSSIP
jgi:hypothetical protein